MPNDDVFFVVSLNNFKSGWVKSKLVLVFWGHIAMFILLEAIQKHHIPWYDIFLLKFNMPLSVMIWY